MRRPAELSRRDVLKAGTGVGAVGVASLLGLTALETEESDAATEPVDDERARGLAERFAPTLYFDAHEPWFPTDPRPYEREGEDGTIVDGFDALDGYTRAVDETSDPPAPTVFYRALRYADSSLAVVQYWYYTTFDQFSANFHWHDWEVVHVFVDVETEAPQLYVASAHSRTVPNNEFLDPDPDREPRILSELGSHSSALSVNEISDRFQRFPADDTIADITNHVLEDVEAAGDLPVAYGLPRDEGFRLPFVVPELDGEPLHEHERLPNVETDHLVDEALTVRSFDALQSPPEDLPERETGTAFGFGGAGSSDSGAAGQSGGEPSVEADVTYDLVPTAELEHVDGFAGPQLSFEFPVPDAAEDAVASHVTSTGVPWEQPRYDNPAEDVTDPFHRATLAERYDAIARPPPVNRVVAAVRELTHSEEAPENEGLTDDEPTVESVVLLESEPEAVPTFAGVAVVEDVPAGEHRFTVNGPGYAPHSERIQVTEPASVGDGDGTEGEGDGGADDGGSDGDSDGDGTAHSRTTTTAGVDGAVGLVPDGEAVKLAVDADGAEADLERLAVEDDFAGRVYDAPLDGPDAVYVHGGGAYTTEVVDADDARGAFRVNPDPGADERVTIARPETGKASLAGFLANVSTETAERVREEVAGDDGGEDRDDAGGGDGAEDGSGDGGDGGSDGGGGPENRIEGLARALEAAADSAERAVEQAKEGNGEGTDERLRAVESRLERAAERLAEAREDLSEPVAEATDRRLDQARRRNEHALEAEKL